MTGGQLLKGFSATLDGSTGCLSWAEDPIWRGATIHAAGALVYNATRGNKALAVLDFGRVVSSTNGPFSVELPTPRAATALIRIG